MEFVKLPDDWLAVELASVEAEIAAWPDGLKESFNSLFPDDPSMHIAPGRKAESNNRPPGGTMFALIDPNWGEPVPVPSTIRATEGDAWEAAITCEDVSLYSGASQFPMPGGTKGSIDDLKRHGYRVARVRVEIE